jgi:potassium-transporting ATPase KdpC subunit
MIREQLKIALFMLILLTVITGLAYPCLITGLAQLLFPHQANGSLILHDGKAAGSLLIGQSFDEPQYLWGRLSATSPVPYNAASSSGSNIGPSNVSLSDAAKARIEALRSADPKNTAPIPVDLVTSSGSGLDPHISLAGAYYQVSRIAKRRGVSENAVKAIIYRNTKGRLLGFIGEPVANVLKVNLDLDSLKK